MDDMYSDALEQLWRASNYGQDEEVLELLQKGIPPNDNYYDSEHNGATPLHAACEANHAPTAEYLIKWGASVSTATESGWTPLHIACYGNSVDCVKLLLDYNCPKDIKDNDGESAVDLARRMGHNDIVKILINFKSQPSVKQLSELNIDKWFDLGLQLGLTKEELFQINSKQTPALATLRAAKTKNTDLDWYTIVEVMLNLGEGHKILSASVRCGWLDVLKHLVDTVGLDKILSWSSDDVSPFYEAFINCHLETVEYLIARKIYDSKALQTYVLSTRIPMQRSTRVLSQARNPTRFEEIRKPVTKFKETVDHERQLDTDSRKESQSIAISCDARFCLDLKKRGTGPFFDDPFKSFQPFSTTSTSSIGQLSPPTVPALPEEELSDPFPQQKREFPEKEQPPSQPSYQKSVSSTNITSDPFDAAAEKELRKLIKKRRRQFRQK